MNPHKARILAMQALFQQDFHKRPLSELKKFDWIDYSVPAGEAQMAQKIVTGVLDNLEDIDEVIVRYSQNWDMDRISHVNKAILRISIYQMMQKEIPMKVIINEAIKLAKNYAEDEAGGFINGILDAYWNSTREEIKL